MTAKIPRKSVARPAARAEGEPRVSLGRLGEFVGFRLRRVQNQLSRDFSAATADEGLRQGLFSALAIISANPGISQNAVSREVGLDKSVTVTMIDEMERKGWAERHRAPEDRRRHALRITPAGQAKLDELFTRMEQTESAVLHQLSEGEMALLSELLDRMYNAAVGDDG